MKSSCASSRVRFAAKRGDVKLEDIEINFPDFCYHFNYNRKSKNIQSKKFVRFDLFLYFRPTEETGVYSLDNIGLVQNAEMGQWEGMSQRKKWANGNEQ